MVPDSPKQGSARWLVIASLLMAIAVAAFASATSAAKGKPKPKPATISIVPSGPTVPKLIAASKKEDGLIIYGNPPAAAGKGRRSRPSGVPSRRVTASGS